MSPPSSSAPIAASPAESAARLGPVQTASRRELVAERIAALISGGVLSVGEELPSERDLARTLSVSRETVRSAIQALAAHGVLKVAQGARTVVARADLGAFPTPRPSLSAMRYSLEEVHEARLLIEGPLAARAAERIDAPALKRLHAALEAQRACGDDPVRYLLSDKEFHQTVYRAGGSDLLSDLAIDLYAYSLDARRRAVARPGGVAEGIADHERILTALEERDGAAAAAAFAAHERRKYDTTRETLVAAPSADAAP